MDNYKLDYGKQPNTLVKFVLQGDDLDPDLITTTLGITPFKAWKKTDLRPSGRPHHTGMWWLKPPCSKYEDFATQLDLLLTQLESLPASFSEFISQFEAGIVVAYSSGEENFGFYLSEDIIKRLCKFGLSIAFDIYPILSEAEDQS